MLVIRTFRVESVEEAGRWINLHLSDGYLIRLLRGMTNVPAARQSVGYEVESVGSIEVSGLYRPRVGCVFSDGCRLYPK